MKLSLFFISGGISGAITDPDSDKAKKHAELFYEEIRKRTYDCEQIALNTGYDVALIKQIKNYLFYDCHLLENNEIKRFDPNFYIAQSWNRLSSKNKNVIDSHDLFLIKHELYESQLLQSGKLNQHDAHIQASKIFDYTFESDLYYEHLRILEKFNKVNNMFYPKNKDELHELIHDLRINLGEIDTSHVTDMSDLFALSNRTDFSGIETWNTSNVTDMSNMFYGCEKFNQDISSWDVSKVEDLSYMFCGCKQFNQDISKWNVSSVKALDRAFVKTYSFRQDLSNWNLETFKYRDDAHSITNTNYFLNNVFKDSAMEHDYYALGPVLVDREDYNFPIFDPCLKKFAGVACNPYELNDYLENDFPPLDSVDVSCCKSFVGVFARSGRLDFSGFEKWYAPDVDNFEGFAEEALSFNQKLDHLGCKAVKNLKKFAYCTNFNQSLDPLINPKLENIALCCANCEYFNQDISKLNVIEQNLPYEKCAGAFSNCKKFELSNIGREGWLSENIQKALFFSAYNTFIEHRNDFNQFDQEEREFYNQQVEAFGGIYRDPIADFSSPENFSFDNYNPVVRNDLTVILVNDAKLKEQLDLFLNNNEIEHFKFENFKDHNWYVANEGCVYAVAVKNSDKNYLVKCLIDDPKLEQSNIKDSIKDHLCALDFKQFTFLNVLFDDSKMWHKPDWMVFKYAEQDFSSIINIANKDNLELKDKLSDDDLDNGRFYAQDAELLLEPYLTTKKFNSPQEQNKKVLKKSTELLKNGIPKLKKR